MKAIIIDDEEHCIESIRLLLEKHQPQVEVIAEITSPKEAIDSISLHQPDLVFLDIKMPVMTGFELIAKIRNIDFHVIFTTAYDEYAIKAFRVNATDYLLKPVSPEELVKAVKKVENSLQQGISSQQLNSLIKQMNSKLNAQEKISLPTKDGVSFIKSEDIIRCEADGNYTKVLCSNKKYLVCKTLKDMEVLLKDNNFHRVHHSHLINLKHINMYHRGKGGVVIMSNGDHVDVSRSRKSAFLDNF
ncbi:MAG: response regulator [Bacteroidetes bacterium]|jgi:two-component system LytT family response regulator|nr:response regulator [Bacteroidota bacterium]